MERDAERRRKGVGGTPSEFLTGQSRSTLAAVEQVGGLVSNRIRFHPLLQPFRDAGIIVYVSMHQEAIWVSVLPSKTDPGKFEHEYMIEHPRWWRVGKYPIEEHADRLAAKLAEGLVGAKGNRRT